MREFSVRQRQEQCHHDAEMNGQQQGHHRCIAQHQQRETARTGQQQECDEPPVHRFLRAVAVLRMSFDIQPKEPGGSCQQTDTSCDSQQNRQARKGIGRFDSQQIVVEGRHAGRREAQHEAVKSQVMKVAAGEGKRIVGVVAAFAVAATEITQAQHVKRCLTDGNARQRAGIFISPKAPHTYAKCDHREHENHAEKQGQGIMREHRVEITGERRQEQRAFECHRQDQEKREAACQRKRQREAVALVKRAQTCWPRIVHVGLHAHLRHRLRHVDGELMRRRVLARMQARAAVMTEVRKEVHVGAAELEAVGHCGEYGAKAFAVAAGIADLHDAADFAFGGCHGEGDRGFVRGQRARLPGKCFKRLHDWLPSIAERRARPGFLLCVRMPCRSPCRRPPYIPCPARCPPSSRPRRKDSGSAYRRNARPIARSPSAQDR